MTVSLQVMALVYNPKAKTPALLNVASITYVLSRSLLVVLLLTLSTIVYYLKVKQILFLPFYLYMVLSVCGLILL